MAPAGTRKASVERSEASAARTPPSRPRIESSSAGEGRGRRSRPGPVVEAEDAERVRHRERLYARARLCRRELVVGEVSKVETLPGLLLLAPVDIVLSPQAGGRLGGHRARTRSAEVGG